MDERQRARTGARIRQARKGNEWTQDDLADKAGVAKNTIIRMEAGQSVRPGNLRAVLDALGIDSLVEPTAADDDVELAQTIVGQWLRRQAPEQRADAIRDLMRFVVSRD